MEEKNKMDTGGLVDGGRGYKRENKDALSRRREAAHEIFFCQRLRRTLNHKWCK